ncbi:DUF4124 domain-containing protein [Kistimonas scapharcae]|uniref:DUF4124 domain-containing protein n=1 Tax=Kistimonas scapharcae TaxID=1036133 RepID=A0ABP8VAR7_9GAMM
MRSLRQALLAVTLLSLFVSPLTSANSEIYRVVEKDGSVVYTDDPAPDADAEAVELKPIQIVPTLTPAQSLSTNKEEPAPPKYAELTITTPEEKENLRNPTEITVKTNLSPELLNGHYIRLMQNGREVGLSKNGTFIIKEPYRGEHTLTAQVIDQRKKVLLSSTPRTIYVYRHSALFNPQPTPPIAPAP